MTWRRPRPDADQAQLVLLGVLADLVARPGRSEPALRRQRDPAHAWLRARIAEIAADLDQPAGTAGPAA